ncbi:hypothetical protein M422DRAFT_189522, partial [Sphaerobolus stellatus SS14]
MKAVAVTLSFPSHSNVVYVEKLLISNRGTNNFYGSPDCLITKEDCQLRICNFSSFPVHIHNRQVLGFTHDPANWLDSKEKLSKEELDSVQAYAYMVKTLMDNLYKVPGDPTIPPGKDGELEGGPKTTEAPPEDVKKEDLLTAVDISPELSPDRRAQLEAILLRNKKAFGLERRLGHYPAKVEIPLREGLKEISCPPFFTSPTNRKVM